MKCTGNKERKANQMCYYTASTIVNSSLYLIEFFNLSERKKRNLQNIPVYIYIILIQTQLVDSKTTQSNVNS